MQIDQVHIYSLHLPFLGEFSHSIRKRRSARNVVVTLIAEEGDIVGYGEGAPRTYVTGESQESAIQTIHRSIRKSSFPWKIEDTATIWRFTDGILQNPGCQSAACAIEIAFLDAWAKYQGGSVIDYFPHDFYTDRVRYGAGLPLADKELIRELCSMIKTVLGIRHIKLKLGKSYKKNRQAFESVREVYGEQIDLKVDVNGAWDHKTAMAHTDLIKEYGVKVVEQPMWPDDPNIAEFSSEMKSGGIFVMADESACSLDDVKKLHQDGHYNMINVRISKCGGLRHSMKIIEYLRKNHISYQIGCHLGESGILSAAGRVLNLLSKDSLYYDGSYDSFLLKENITEENVSFGAKGTAGPIDGPGLGIQVAPTKLKRLSDSASTITVNRR